MSLYILRDGQKIGPFSDEAARVLLEQGDVKPDAQACRAGGGQWEPLSVVLQTPAAPTPAPSPHPTPRKDSPPPPAPEASPEKESRAQLYYDLCQTAGTDYFTGVTKAHCQVLLGFLDVSHPRWDADMAHSLERYFFPAIAEKFPQLVNKAWRGRLHYGESPAEATKKVTRKIATAKLAKAADSPLRAIGRGLVLGLCLLALLFLVYWAWRNGKLPLPRPSTAAEAL